LTSLIKDLKQVLPKEVINCFEKFQPELKKYQTDIKN